MIPQLLGLGEAGLNAEVEGFLLKAPNPTSTQVADFLILYRSGTARDDAAKALIAKGVNSATVASALNWLDTSSKINWNAVWGVLSVASGVMSGFHGYRRNQSVGWGVAWFVLGTILPVITPTIAVAQGYGKRKDK